MSQVLRVLGVTVCITGDGTKRGETEEEEG